MPPAAVNRPPTPHTGPSAPIVALFGAKRVMPP